MLHVSANRPDKTPGDQGNRNKFRLSMSPAEYASTTTAPVRTENASFFLFAPCCNRSYNDHFSKTGSGQTHLGKVETKGRRFFSKNQKQGTRRFKYGFMMTYVRDSNYQVSN